MRFTIGRLIAAAAMLQFAGSPLSAQDAPRVFKPSGQWTADFGDDYCRLLRSFSDGSETVSLAFERIEPGTGMRLALVGNAVRPFRRAEELGWSWLPGGEIRPSRYIRSLTGDGQAYFNLGNVTIAAIPTPAPEASPAPPALYDRAAEQADARNVSGIRLTSGLVSPLEIQTGNLEAPIKVLQACTDDLVKSWGIDVEADKLATRPVVQWVQPPELPREIFEPANFAKILPGSNRIRLMVASDGTATKCVVHWPTLDSTILDKVCAAILESAKFTPARDASGNALASYWFGTMSGFTPPRGRRR